MNSPRTHVIIGSRGSELALWQAHFLQNALSSIGYTSEIEIIKTQGDAIQHLSLEKLEGKGFFTKEIEDALLEGRVDVAVHSHKDLPTASTLGLMIAAVSHREDPAELLLISKDKVDATQPLSLMANAMVGTSSSRRAIQMHLIRPDIALADIRGNVPTRIRKLREGQFDAILLAYAGVHRLQLNLEDLEVIKLDPKQFIPAPAQGVLAFQCRENDTEMRRILAQLHQPDVQQTVQVERKVMQLFNGGCHMPLGVFCHKHDDVYEAWAVRAVDREQAVSRCYMQGTDPEALARSLYQRLSNQQKRSVLFCSTNLSDTISQQLHAAGLTIDRRSFVRTTQLPLQTKNITADWLFFTSKSGVQHFFDQAPILSASTQIAAYGEETAVAIRRSGYKVAFTGTGEAAQTAQNFAPLATGLEVLFAGATYHHPGVREAVRAYATVQHISVYENTLVDQDAPVCDIVVFTSPMQAEGYLRRGSITSGQIVIAIGPSTAAWCQAHSIAQVILPPVPAQWAIADLICGLP